MYSQCKRKRSNKFHGPDSTLAIKDSYGDSPRDEDFDHETLVHKETTSNGMVIANCKKKLSNEIQFSDSILSNKDSQADSKGDEGQGHFDLSIPHKETSSGELIQAKKQKKHIDKLQGLDDTLALEDSHENSQRVEQDVDLHVNIVHKEAPSLEMMNTKHKRKYFKLQASDSNLTSKNSQGDSQGDEDFCRPNGDISHMKIPSCEIKNTKRKKHSNRHQGSDVVLAIKDSLGDSQENRGNASVYENKVHNETSPNEMMDTKRKKKHSNKQRASENEYKGSDDGHASKNGSNGEAKKVPSRSARRKKAKKIWHRTHGYKKKEKPSEHADADQISNIEKDIAPLVIVRPGHIRFECSDECSDREDKPVETLLWKGTNSKKKGQKWGREKSYNKWKNDTSNQLFNEESDAKEAEVVEVSNEKSAVEEMEAYNSISEQVEPGTKCNENSMVKDIKAVKQLIDYESFLPLVRLPEEGDVLVYRVVELSSSWCPELSPFRIGRVSSYDSICSKVVLLPLPEYPLVSKEMSEEGQESCSLYKEDGTLEIDFTYLVDVRLFKAPESEETTPNTPIEKQQKATSVNNQESEGCSNHAGAERQYSEGWEAINFAIKEKKAQLQKQNNFNKRNLLGSTAPGSWSYKALRRNALGPILAMLRSSDGDFDMKASEGVEAAVNHAG